MRPGDRAIVERLEKSRELIRRQFAAEPSIRAELLFEIADKFAELRDLKTLTERHGRRLGRSPGTPTCRGFRPGIGARPPN